MSAITSTVTSPIMELPAPIMELPVTSPDISDNHPANTPILEDYIQSKNNLPAKYAKFLQFGYFLLNHINSNSHTPLFDDHLIHHSLHLFNTTHNQIQFIHLFLQSSKSIHKTIRKTISIHKKNLAKNLGKPTVSPKPPSLPKKKSNKASKPSEVTTSEELGNNKDKKSKATNAVKEHIQSNNLILETNDNKEKEKKVKEVKEKEVKEKKEKEVKEKKEKKEKEVKEVKEKKEKKEKEVKEKKDKEVKEKKEKEVKQENDEDEEKEVSVFVYDDKQYLIDENNNVYDFESHDVIGSFANGVITFK